MKKVLLLLSMGIFLLAGCSKEEPEIQIEDQTANATYVLNVVDGTAAWEGVDMDVQSARTNSSDASRSSGLRAFGRLGVFGLPTAFSARETNSGTRGRGLLQLAGPGGTAARLILNSSSVVSIGDGEVVYGGQITRVIQNNIPPPPPPPGCPPMCPPPPPCSPFDLGTYVYFAVKDNGFGNNAPDQFKGVIIPACSEIPDGGASFPWFIFPWNDVNTGDVVYVLD